ncbi:hypothetical protein ACU8DI_14975 [Psychroserpens sp. BH13MA-6]
MKSIFISIISFLFSLYSFSQNTTIISLTHNNSGRMNSTLKINFGFSVENDSTPVYCEIYNKKFKKNIHNKEYEYIMKEVMKISSDDILSRDDMYLDASETTISISQMQSSVSFTISSLHHTDDRTEYIHFKNAVATILDVVELNLTDLR